MKKLLKGTELSEGVRRLSVSTQSDESQLSSSEQSSGASGQDSPTPLPADKLAKLKEAAFELGYSEGLAKAKQEADIKIAEQLQQRIKRETEALREQKKNLAAIIKSLQEESVAFQDQRAKHMAVNERQLVDLSLELVYKLAGKDQIFTKMVQEGVKAQLEKLQSAEIVTIICNEAVKERLAELEHGTDHKIRYVIDNSKSGQKCAIGVNQSNYEVGLSSRLKLLEEQLKVLCEHRSK